MFSELGFLSAWALLPEPTAFSMLLLLLSTSISVPEATVSEILNPLHSAHKEERIGCIVKS